jgi:hypothetical protein
MSFSKDIEKFTAKAKSDIDAAQKEPIIQFLTDFLGDDFSKVEHIEFDSDTSKFFNLKAPEEIIAKFKDKDYLKDTSSE